MLTKLIKFNIYNERTHQIIKFPKVEDDLFKLSCFIKNGDICIDVGANVGMYSIKLAKLCGNSGLILSFEPVPEVFKYLKNNIFGRLYKFSNILPYQMALGNLNENVSLIFTSDRNGRINDPLSRIDEHNGDIKMTTLDTIAEKLDLRRVDFIKIDVEGYELNVLKGSKNVLKRYHPIILMEMDNVWAARYNSSYQKILFFLHSFGYKQVILEQCVFKLTTEGLMGNIYFKWFG